jgi:outer membrane protein OmpA-like peptidoglycan-associated protein
MLRVLNSNVQTHFVKDKSTVNNVFDNILTSLGQYMEHNKSNSF